MRRRIALFAVIVMFAPRLAAQDATERVTLDEALARGLQNSQRLAELQARVDIAAAAEQGRAAADKPTLSLLGGYTRTNHVTEFVIPVPGQAPRVVYPDIPDNFRTRLDFNWPIYTGGRADALERAARAERHAAGADLDAARADLRLEITRAFWALVTAAETEAVLVHALASLDAHVRDLRVRLEQGLIPPNDLLSAEAQRSRQRLLAIEARNARGTVEADLRRLTGIESDARIEPVTAADTTATPARDLAALVREALAARPERRALVDRAAAARERVQASDAGRLPQLALNSGYDYARPNPRIFPRAGEWDDSWDVSINASWMLWDGGRRAAERAEAAAGVRALEARAADFDRQVTFEVRQRVLDGESAVAAIEAAEDGVRAAREARRVIGERYNAGVATSTDLLDAETAVLQAELDRTRAIANARLAQARLNRALGR